MQYIIREIRFYSFQLRQNFRNKKVLSVSFALQIIGMFLNNISFFVIWMMFSKTIGVVNGWGAWQTFGMLSVSIFAFGIGQTLSGTRGGLLYERVPSGAFDMFLTKPKSLYLRIINHDFHVSALGDLLQGFLGMIIFLVVSRPSIEMVFILLLLLPPAILIQTVFMMVADCIIFWLPHAHNMTRAMADLILLPTTQPISLLQGGMRLFYLFIVPALLVAGLPVEAFIHKKWSYLALSYGIALAWFGLSVLVLHLSLKRYESGNSIG